MALKIDVFDVAFLNADGERVDAEIEVWGVDKLRAEMEARRIGAKGHRAAVKGKADVDVTDMGDHLTRDALAVWHACVRLGIYNAPADQWRTRDYIGAEKRKDDDGTDADGEDVDPTPSAPSTGADFS